MRKEWNNIGVMMWMFMILGFLCDALRLVSVQCSLRTDSMYDRDRHTLADLKILCIVRPIWDVCIRIVFDENKSFKRDRITQTHGVSHVGISCIGHCFFLYNIALVHLTMWVLRCCRSVTAFRDTLKLDKQAMDVSFVYFHLWEFIASDQNDDKACGVTHFLICVGSRCYY